MAVSFIPRVCISGLRPLIVDAAQEGREGAANRDERETGDDEIGVVKVDVERHGCQVQSGQAEPEQSQETSNNSAECENINSSVDTNID